MALKENWFEKDVQESKTKISAKRLLEPLSESPGQSLFRADLEEKSPKKILRQTQDNPKTNIRQSQDKPKTILRQTQDNPKTNIRQSQDKPKTILRQSQNDTILDEHDLSGLQKEIFDLFVDLARKNGSQETGRVAVKTLAEQLACPLKSLPKTIQRLEQKGLIVRKTVKSGPGGWTQYEIPLSI